MKQSKWVNEQTCTLEYYSGIKHKELLRHVTIWMNLREDPLSGIRGFKEHCVIILTWHSYRQSHSNEQHITGCRKGVAIMT